MRWCLGLWLALFLCHLVGSSFCCCVSGSCKGPDLCSAGDASLNISPTRSQVWLGRLHLNSHFLKIRVRFRVNIQIFNKNFIKNFACKPDLYDFFFFSFLFPAFSPNPFCLQLPADLTKMHLTDNPHPQVTHVPSSQSGCSIASDSGSSSLSDIYQVELHLFLSSVSPPPSWKLHFAFPNCSGSVLCCCNAGWLSESMRSDVHHTRLFVVFAVGCQNLGGSPSGAVAQTWWEHFCSDICMLFWWHFLSGFSLAHNLLAVR